MNLADLDITAAALPKSPKPECLHASRQILPSDFPERLLYSLLKWRLKRPNGFLTFLSSKPDGDPDGPFKWDFIFCPIQELTLNVIRVPQHLEILRCGLDVTDSHIIAYLDHNMAIHSGDYAPIPKQLDCN